MLRAGLGELSAGDEYGLHLGAPDSGHAFRGLHRPGAVSYTHLDFHTNITCLQRDGEVLFQGNTTGGGGQEQTDRGVLTVEEIVRFADCLDVTDVAEVLRRQIAYNSAISQEGLKGG